MARPQVGTAPSRTRDLAEYGTGPGGGGGSTTALTNSRVPFALPAVGEWIGQHAAAIEAQRPANGELRLGQLWLPGGTYSDALVGVANPGSAGATARLGIYADNPTTPGRPGTFILGSGSADATQFGINFTGLGFVVPTGGALMWAGVVNQSSPSTLPNLYCNSRSVFPPVTPNDPNGLTFTNIGYIWTTTGVTGAIPTTATFTSAAAAAPRLFFKRSA